MYMEITIMKKTAYRTDFLFAKSSFLLGMGSLMGVFSDYYTFNTSGSELEADNKALASDFGTVGQDMYKAMLAL